jgi:hypothetical protein
MNVMMHKKNQGKIYKMVSISLIIFLPPIHMNSLYKLYLRYQALKSAIKSTKLYNKYALLRE